MFHRLTKDCFISSFNEQIALLATTYWLLCQSKQLWVLVSIHRCAGVEK